MGRGVNHLEALAPEKHRVALAMGKLSENFGVPGILVTGLAHRLFVQRSGHNAADPAGQRPIDGGAHREEGAASSHRRNLSDGDLLKGNRVRVHDIDAAGLYLRRIVDQMQRRFDSEPAAVPVEHRCGAEDNAAPDHLGTAAQRLEHNLGADPAGISGCNSKIIQGGTPPSGQNASLSLRSE